MLIALVWTCVWVNAGPRTDVSQVRVSQGPLGKFGGADHPCDEKDAHRDAPWARGACLISCKPAGRSERPACAKAIRLCRRLPWCAAVNINVEGTVATLKAETELSRRTSKLKTISFSQNLGDAAAGHDSACPERNVQLPGSNPSEACMLECPKLNCTGATALCYSMQSCTAIDISFGLSTTRGHMCVARLRFS